MGQFQSLSESEMEIMRVIWDAGSPVTTAELLGFLAAFYGGEPLKKEELDTLTVDKLESILAFANKAASITTSRHGAIPAMPTLEEIEK